MLYYTPWVQKCNRALNLVQNLTLDESVVLHYGLSITKQFIKGKPMKIGCIL